MQVVEQHDQRLGGGDRLQELSDRPMGAVPRIPARAGPAGGLGAQGRQDVTDLGPRVGIERIQTTRLQPRDVLVECVHEDPERKVALELRRASGQHNVTAGVGAGGQVGQQAGLADPGFTDDRSRRRPALGQLRLRLIQRRPLGGASDEPISRHRIPRAEDTRIGDQGPGSGCCPDVGNGGGRGAWSPCRTS